LIVLPFKGIKIILEAKEEQVPQDNGLKYWLINHNRKNMRNKLV